MRTYIVYSKTASTAPYIRDLKKAGRHDVLLHSIISALFASHTFRDDVELHLILMGPPTSPRHIIMTFDPDNTISKKNLKKTVELALRRYRKEDETTKPITTKKVHPGVFIDNKSIQTVVEELKEQNKEIFVLDANGEHVKDTEPTKLENATFILGDHDGFDKKTKKYLKKNTTRLSLGHQVYFTSQAITILNYELDNI